MLTHAQFWRGIDALAEKHGLSASGLAKKAGFSATLFNVSKRKSGGRERWPSCESLIAVLTATGDTLAEFSALACGTAAQPSLPLRRLSQVVKAGAPHKDKTKNQNRDGEGLPWPALGDAAAFAMEVDTAALEPEIKKGAVVILSFSGAARRGDRVAVRLLSGEVLLRTLSREGASKIELSALGAEEAAAPETLSRTDIEWMARLVWMSL